MDKLKDFKNKLIDYEVLDRFENEPTIIEWINTPSHDYVLVYHKRLDRLTFFSERHESEILVNEIENKNVKLYET